jgi:hypothetical protein
LEQTLPAGFEDLSPFVGEWSALATPEARYRQRTALPMERLTAYYQAVQPRLGAIFGHLDRFPFGPPLPAPEAALFNLAMAMVEVAQAVEVFGVPGVPQAPAGFSFTQHTLTRA